MLNLRPLAEEDLPVFHRFVGVVAVMPGMLEEFDRLRGTSLSMNKSAIVRMIDAHTHKDVADLALFLEFTVTMWLCLPPEAKDEIRAIVREENGNADAP